VVDREHQCHGRQPQRDQAHAPQLAGLRGKLAEGQQHGLGNHVRHETGQHLLFQHLAETPEHGKRTEQREHHGEERHQRDRGREREAAGRQAQPILAEAVAITDCP